MKKKKAMKRARMMTEWSNDSLLSRKRACFTARKWFVMVNDPLIQDIFTFDTTDDDNGGLQIHGCITLRHRRTIHFFRRLLPDAFGFFASMPRLRPLPRPAWCDEVLGDANALLAGRRGSIHNSDC